MWDMLGPPISSGGVQNTVSFRSVGQTIRMFLQLVLIAIVLESFGWGKLWNEMAGPSLVADILCRDDKQESQGKRTLISNRYSL